MQNGGGVSWAFLLAVFIRRAVESRVAGIAFFIQGTADGVTRAPLCHENCCYMVLKFCFILL